MALSGSVSTNGYDGRYYTMSWSATQSIANNQSTIYWTLSCDGGDSWYAERTLWVYIAGQVVANKTDRVQRYKGVISSGSFTVNHAADGGFGFQVVIQAAVYVSSVNCTCDTWFSLDQIPRQANITSAPDFNDEGNPTIYYSNPAGTAVSKLEACISLTGAIADIAYRDISKTGSSYTFNLTEAERDVLRKNTLSGNSRTVYFFIATTIGGTVYRQSVGKTFTVINCAPTLNPTVEDLGSASFVLTQNRDKLIRYFNYPKATFNAVASKGASIINRTVTCGSQTLAASGDYVQFNNVDSNIFTFTITDNRGNTATKTITKDMIEYIMPSCYVTIDTDLNPDNTASMILNIAGDCYQGSFGAVDNALTIEYRYKNNTTEYPVDENGNEIWYPADATTSDSKYTATTIIDNIDYTDTYTVQARIRDSIYTWGIAAKEEVVKIIPTFDWSETEFNFNVPVHSKGGFTYDIPIKYNSDVNMILTSGKYYIGTEAINKPGDGYNGWLEVYASSSSGDYVYQKYITYTGEKYERWRNASVWGNWTLIPTISDIPPAAADYIVSQGTMAGWKYRSWNSGFIEMWAVVAPAYANGNVLLSGYAFPFTLKTTLTAIGTLCSTDHAVTQLDENVKVVLYSTKVDVSVHSVCGGYTSGSYKAVSVYVTGTYK